jgi:hypothetical protein
MKSAFRVHWLGGRHPNYRLGWTVFHLPSTPSVGRRAANFSRGRCATSYSVDAAVFRHMARYILGAHAPCDSTPWRTEEQHGARAQWGRERLPCLLPMQAAAGRTPTLLAFTLEQCPSWPRERALGSPAVGFVAGHDDLGGGRYFIYGPPPKALEGRPIHIRLPGYTQ